MRRWTGIPVSVGVGPTKTLAKPANATAKRSPALRGVLSVREGAVLDRLLGRQRADTMRYYVREMQMALPDAEARAVGDAEDLEYIRSKPASELSWWDLDRLAEQDSAEALAGWEAIKAAALDELTSGHRAAMALVMRGWEQPMDRARFLAIRHDLAQGWNPQGGIEHTLLDQMAQAWTMQLYWQEVATTRLMMENKPLTRDEQRWELPRVDRVQASDHAALQVDRWNRMFLRCLRALRDMRRYAPAITIQNPAQVNIAAEGGQQVNVAAQGE